MNIAHLVRVAPKKQSKYGSPIAKRAEKPSGMRQEVRFNSIM
jgi:hypothetical protein